MPNAITTWNAAVSLKEAPETDLVPELLQEFDQLYQRYKSRFRSTNYTCQTRLDLRKSIPKVRGVYLMWRIPSQRLIYIGSSGKVLRALALNGSSVRQRLFGANTPYYFDGNQDLLRYGPTSAKVPPSGYLYSMAIGDLQVEVIETPDDVAPTALEHIILQGYMNQYRTLPDINQKM